MLRAEARAHSSHCGRAKCQEHGIRGPCEYDGAKKLCGCKHMTLCDAGGTGFESVVLPVNIGERAGALILFEKVKPLRGIATSL